MRRVSRRKSLQSCLCVRSNLLLPLVARCLETIEICIWFLFVLCLLLKKHVCVRDVMDVVFSVCIVRCGAVCARVWEV